MTIRYTCVECDVAMKIKDELAGKNGKCPQCKTAFVVPSPEVAADESLLGDEPLDEGWDDEGDDEDEFLDMPLEVTAAPAEPVVEMPPPVVRDRKDASETKKATRIKPRKKKPAKSSDGFDPTDVLFEDDEPTTRPGSPATVGPSLDDGDLDDDSQTASSMAAMFRDFTPAGGRKRETPTTNSTNVAAELLARKQEEKQNKKSATDTYDAASADDEGSELVEQLTDFVKQYGLYVGIGLAVIVGLYFGMNAMLGGGRDMPDLTAVYGTVTRSAGNASLQITFTPAAPEGQRVDPDAIDQSDGTAFTNNEGEYEIMYARGYPGLPPGRYRVSIVDNGRQVYSDFVEIKDGQSALNFSL